MMAKQGTGGFVDTNGGGETVEAGGDVMVSEEVIWKARAEEAEEKLAVSEAQVQALEMDLASANQAVQMVERRGEIDRELTSAKAIDLETARLLTEAAIDGMDAPDVSVAVRELCDRKPFLFACKRQGSHEGVAMGPVAVRGQDDELETMASSARSSGDRSELLRYLRVRRGQ
tara:strand:+ start:630693 stop:631211 length:519 start_codon:yes stop_codon:yes gene_type:complete